MLPTDRQQDKMHISQIDSVFMSSSAVAAADFRQSTVAGTVPRSAIMAFKT